MKKQKKTILIVLSIFTMFIVGLFLSYDILKEEFVIAFSKSFAGK